MSEFVSGFLAIPLPGPPPSGKSLGTMGRHITLLHLRKQPRHLIERAFECVKTVCQRTFEPIQGNYGGEAQVFKQPEQDVHVYPAEVGMGAYMRDALLQYLTVLGVDTYQTFPEFKPHVTVAYANPGATPPPDLPREFFVADVLEFYVGKDVRDIPLYPALLRKAGASGAEPGSQRLQHRYVSRKPKPGGGWEYVYPEDVDRKNSGKDVETTAAGKRSKKDPKPHKQLEGTERARKIEEKTTEIVDVESTLVVSKTQGQIRAHQIAAEKEQFDDSGVEQSKDAHPQHELLGVKKFTSVQVAQMFAKISPGTKVQEMMVPGSPFVFYYLAKEGKPVNPDTPPMEFYDAARF